MMPINWFLESGKWKLLVDPFEKISFIKSLKAILSGISIALLTPNRIGEYGGRMVMVEAKNNWKAVISTIVSSIAQNIWNIGLGLIAAMLFLRKNGALESYLFWSGLIVSTLFLLVIVIIYFNMKWINVLLKKWKSNRWINKALFHLSLLEKYQHKTLLKVLLLALVRYAVYFLQYYFILKFFGLEVNLIAGFIGIATIFLVQTSLPLPPIVGFLARGEIALLVWEGMEFNSLSILGASYALWFLNLIIPSIIGSVIILSSDLWRSLGLGQFFVKK